MPEPCGYAALLLISIIQKTVPCGLLVACACWSESSLGSNKKENWERKGGRGKRKEEEGRSKREEEQIGSAQAFGVLRLLALGATTRSSLSTIWSMYPPG